MHDSWKALSLLGDSRLLLPALAFLLLPGLLSAHAAVWRMAITTAVVAAIVLSTKLAFLGWGVGIAAIDFTGFSGHAAMAAVSWPLLLQAFFGPSTPTRRTVAIGAGLALAAAIATSRIPLGAHSVAEVVSGWLLGALAAVACISRAAHAPPPSAPALPLAGLALGAALMATLPNLHTHDVVIRAALALSGQKMPFSRASLHYDDASSAKNVGTNAL